MLNKADVWFSLNKRQMKAIKPLLDKAKEAFDNGEKGMVLLQVWHNREVTGGFIPREQTLRIINAYEADPGIEGIY